MTEASHPRSVLTRLAAAAEAGYLMPDDIDRDIRATAHRLAGRHGRTVSVIIPTRDREAVVGDAIDAALSQSIPALEIVVIDDASRDETQQLLRRSFGDVIDRGELVVRTTTGLGQGGARNLGLETARGRLIAYLDSDNTWHPDHLLWMLAAGVDPGDADLAYSAVRVTQLDTGVREVVSRPFVLTDLFRKNFVDTSAMVHDAELPRRLGGWDNAMSRFIDWDFALRMVSERGGVHVPVVTVEMNLAAALGNVTLVEAADSDIDRLDDKYPVQRTAVGVGTLSYTRFRQRCREEHAPAPVDTATHLVVVAHDAGPALAALDRAGLDHLRAAHTETVGPAERPAAATGALVWVPDGREADEDPISLRHRIITGLAAASGAGDDLRLLPGWSDAAGMATSRRQGDRPVILIIGVHADVGGAERLVIELVRQLRDRYDFVYLVTAAPTSTETLHTALEDAGARVVDLGRGDAPAASLAALWAVRVAFGVDLVLLTNGSPWLASHGAELRMLFADVPIVGQHYYDERAGWIATHVASGAGLFDHFIAINHGIRARLTGEFGLPPERVSLIHHPIDLDRIDRGRVTPRESTRARLGIGEDRVVVAQVGRLVDQKQPLVFLELAQRWKNRPEYLFVLVGDGPLRPRCDAAISSAGLDNVIVLPFIDEVPAFLHACDMLVLSSSYEGLPLVALEAIGVGTPVLSTDVGDLAWCIERFGGGESVSTHDPRAVLAVDLDAFRRRWRRDDVAIPNDRAAFAATFGGAAVAERYAEVLRLGLD